MHSGAYVALSAKLATNFTVFAFDTPGFGDSEALDRKHVDAFVFADALAAAFEALGMPRCPLYGLDTGAAIALAFAVRHPDRTSGLVLMGLPIFPRRQRLEYVRNYTPPYLPQWDGSHLPALWIRIRDHRTFFPWYRRDDKGRRLRAMPSASELHERTMGFLRAGDNYRHGYNSAFGLDAVRAIASIRIPMTLIGRRDDTLLSPALRRLTGLKRGQRVVWIGSGGVDAHAAIADGFRRYAKGEAPDDRETLRPPRRSGIGYADLPFGQVRVRTNLRRRGVPLVLLHDLPGSSAVLEPALATLGRDRPVIAPELPGCGDSDAMPSGKTARDFADAVVATLRSLGFEHYDIGALGWSTAIAIALASGHPAAVRRLVLEDLPLLSPGQRRAWSRRYAPEIVPEWDGAHLFRTWLMIRDQQLFWPWFDRSREAAIVPTTSLSAEALHRRSVETLKSAATYGDPIRAALAMDVAKHLRRLKLPVLLCAEPNQPNHSSLPAVARLVRSAMVVTLRPGYESRRRALARFLDREW
jgi:pimeloyl-ACP methyl ester carboxylesterase